MIWELLLKCLFLFRAFLIMKTTFSYFPELFENPAPVKYHLKNKIKTFFLKFIRKNWTIIKKVSVFSNFFSKNYFYFNIVLTILNWSFFPSIVLFFTKKFVHSLKRWQSLPPPLHLFSLSLFPSIVFITIKN